MEQFNDLTPGELQALIKGKAEIDQAEWRRSAELARLNTALLITPHVKGKIEPKKLYRFSWEDEISKDVMIELENTDWEALEKKYLNTIPYVNPHRKK